MPVYNAEKYVGRTIESLLNQDYKDFCVIVADDCSLDKTGEILKQVASKDYRVKYLRNKARLGMIMNWRKVFFEACKIGVDYFAWASDHDLYDEKWLRYHVEILNQYQQVVLAYPLPTAIDSEGKVLEIPPTRFETFGLGKKARVRKTCTRLVGAGNMIYGLFRASALKRHKIFPYFSMPDRLLLMQMSVSGTFCQINKHLWHRRYLKDRNGIILPNYSQLIERHRSTLYFASKIPWHSHFPALGQAAGLLLHFLIKPPSGDYRNAFWGLYMAILHLITKRRNLRRELKIFLRQLPHKI